MHDIDIALAARNIVFLECLLILMLPDHAVASAHRNLRKAWRSIQVPRVWMKPNKKGSRFWEIDMTKFEP